jgi:Mn2+/Fe2+ NRAMP family transporter
MLNAYVTAFLAACVTYMIMLSNLKKDDDYLNKEALMYSIGAGAVGFAIVQFMVQNPESVVSMPVVVATPSSKVTSKPANAIVGITGETIMNDAFPSK